MLNSIEANLKFEGSIDQPLLRLSDSHKTSLLLVEKTQKISFLEKSAYIYRSQNLFCICTITANINYQKDSESINFRQLSMDAEGKLINTRHTMKIDSLVMPS